MKRPSGTRKRGTRRQAPDSVGFLDTLYGSDPTWSPLVERARVNRNVAHAIYDLRTASGLTQRQLADLVGTKQPVIARLEDADYDGHSLSMLARIAAALGQRIEVRFVPVARAVKARRVAEGRETTRPAWQASEGRATYEATVPRARGGHKVARGTTAGRTVGSSSSTTRRDSRRKPL